MLLIFFQSFDSDFKGLYLVDWNLPDRPGTEIISFIRENDPVSPVFMISAYSKKEEIIEGLKSGADDYLTKPFNFDELLARIDNANRKFNYVSKELDPAGLKMLPEANSFVFDGNTVNLTAREYIIFNFLFENQNKPVSREDLIEQFSKEEEMTSRNIDVHVFSLRKKIKKVNLAIDTVWGLGYKLTLA
jgi:two-component system OmpR family response regulator